MEKEFVPYEQALALKELRFNEPCFGKFYHNHLEIGGSWLNSEFNKDKTDGNIFTSAPTFSQAFSFFRDGYEVLCSVQYNRLPNRFWFKIEDAVFNSVEFKTYEEAELECLKKLIEIVNNN